MLPNGTVIGDEDTIRGRGHVFAPDDLPALNGFPECTWDAESGELLERAWAFNHDEAVRLLVS